jgi:GNAT superfamily N-acetyltransferase
VDALVAAFWDYPETVHLLADERRRRHVLPRYLASDCADSLRYDALLGVRVDGEIAGAAAWLPPEAYPIPLARQVAQVLALAPSLPWGLGAAREALRGQAANRQAHRRDPHWFLRSVGVHPAHQGTGVGRALIDPVLERADRDAVGCFLFTALLGNVAFYERFGFTVLSTYRPTPRWPQVWAMWRDPVLAGWAA